MNQAVRMLMGMAAVAVLALTQACSSSTTAAPDVTASVKDALKSAGLSDVSVTQDREKGVVTLKGSVASDAMKERAAALTKPLIAGQVLGNEIAVLPPGNESDAKAVNSDLDDGIKKNLDAALLENKMHDQVKYSVSAGVVTLTGEVNTQAQRTEAARVATGVPNVQQVVNKLDVKNQPASSTK